MTLLIHVINREILYSIMTFLTSVIKYDIIIKLMTILESIIESNVIIFSFCNSWTINIKLGNGPVQPISGRGPKRAGLI